MQMPYKYNKLRGRIIEMYGSQDNFALKIGISKNSMSRKMNCKTGFSQRDISIWSNLLNICPNEYGEYFFT